MRIAVVIPAFNEARSIAEVVRDVVDHGYAPIVVDDGSSDETGAEARGAGATVLRHWVNRGYGAALTTGSDWAVERGYEIVVHFDADGQHAVEEIEAIVEPVTAGEADATIGSRFLGEGRRIPLLRKILIKAAITFTRVLSGVKLSDAHNGFRAFSSSALRQLKCREDGMAYASEVVEQIARHKLRLREVPVTISYTDYSLGKGEGNLAKLRVGLQFLWGKLTQ